MGNPIDPVFSDREVFADFFTRYYTDFEPESSLVAENDGEVIGYLLGCRRYRYHWLCQKYLLLARIVPKVVARFVTGRYNGASRRFLTWVIFRSIRETPTAPSETAHFHINILSPWRNGVAGRELIFTYLNSLPGTGVRGVYGQIQTRDDRRPAKIFERYGFKLLERRRITKFERYDPKPLYVSTFYKFFDA